jgi:hypothetical protein
MDGTYIITDSTTKNQMGSVSAPCGTDTNEILKCYVASLGLPESAATKLRADWCPIIKWEGHLANMLTPFSEME